MKLKFILFLVLICFQINFSYSISNEKEQEKQSKNVSSFDSIKKYFIKLKTYVSYAKNVLESLIFKDNSKPKYKLIWSDEFNGNQLENSKWKFLRPIDCYHFGNQELQCYTNHTKNCHVKDGYLRLTAINETISGPVWFHNKIINANLTKNYSSAKIVNRFPIKYGKVCVRAKLPFGQGLWPAIWMLPTYSVYGRWPHSGEIDLMEAINLPETYTDSEFFNISGALHYGANTNISHSTHTEYIYNIYSHKALHPSFYFHTYCLEWEEKELRWYFDDKLFGKETYWFMENNHGRITYNTTAPFDQYFNVILNVAVGGTWPGPVGKDTMFPKTMFVDWVRIYECSIDAKTGKGCKSK